MKIVRVEKFLVISSIAVFIVFQNLCVTAQDSSTSSISTTSSDEVTSISPTTDGGSLCQAPSTPNCSATNITENSAIVICSTTIDSDPSCNEVLTVDCIVTKNQTEVQYEGIVLELNSLNASTFYNCTIGVYTSNKQSSENTSVTFFTSAALPSQPTNLQLHVESTYFNISWEPPEQNAENITKYWIIIENLGTSNQSHYVGQNCTPSDDQLSIKQSTNQMYFFYEEVFPDFQYNVTVYAESNEGNNGSKRAIGFVTPSSGSSPPLNVKHLLIEYQEEKNVLMDQNISWSIPCNTNGPAEYFNLTWFDNETNDILGSTYVNYFIYNTEYYHVLENLSASTNYTVTISLTGLNNIEGNSTNVTFQTDSNFPSAPLINILNIGPTYFTINWTSPSNNPGSILKYHLTIINQGPRYTHESHCSFPNFPQSTNISLSGEYQERMYHDAISYYDYQASVRAETARGVGNESNVVSLLTNSSEPGTATNIEHYFDTEYQNENYKSRVYLNYTPTCEKNGPNVTYTLSYTGVRTNYSDVSDSVVCNDGQCTFSLLSQYNYSCYIETNNGYYKSESEGYTFISPSGVPQISNNTTSIPAKSGGTSEASITFSKQTFDWSQGDIQYVAVIVSNKNVTGGEYGRWDGQSWPQPTYNVASVYYQTSIQFWNPWENDTDSVTFIIGSNSSCTDEEQYCNRPLSAGTQYFIILRAFTNQFYRNSWPVKVQTDSEGKLHFILGMILGLLFTLAILIVGFILWKKGIIKIVRPQKNTEPQSTNMNLANFLEYCNYLEQNPEVLKKQYADLCAESELACSEYQTTFAQRPENKRKNRYINILPYDHTRVKLHIDEDDEMCSDYINASYIQGYGEEVKYISTQGPLFSTCRDFWRMIIQEDARMIIMVARFVEGHKDKCYKYFPKKGENMVLGDDMEIRCCTELDFGIYRIRSLQVRKDLKQVTVTHMQFLQWPDFGVPSDPQNILQFYQHFKQRWAYEGGPAVIHCSAGVGRTGTLIATDILLQAIKAGSKIDVYNTVLELRKQRINMVQTEKQYVFIYSLVKNIIEDPMNSEEYNDEHFYENIDILAYRDDQNEEPKETTAETEF